MRMKKKFESRSSSYKRELKNLDSKEAVKEPLLVLSFKDFDINQGQSFEEWEADQLLALAINKLRSVTGLTAGQALQQQIIKNYPKVPFPPDSAFTHPKHVPNDVIWASMHIQGKECVIGYLIDNIFYVVFLDRDHEFWICKK